MTPEQRLARFAFPCADYRIWVEDVEKPHPMGSISAADFELLERGIFEGADILVIFGKDRL